MSHLDCSGNQLTSLDVSKNTELERLNCGTAISLGPPGGNQLTSLDVSHNTALERLDISLNQLTSLDVSHNTALIRLRCFSNQLTSLDVSKNSALEWLDCWDNQLTRLDVSKNITLERLNCSDNQLTSISSLVDNEGLGRGDAIIVTNNCIGSLNPDTAMNDIQILTNRIGEPIYESDWLVSGFVYEPQNECETAVVDWSLH